MKLQHLFVLAFIIIAACARSADIAGNNEPEDAGDAERRDGGSGSGSGIDDDTTNDLPDSGTPKKDAGGTPVEAGPARRLFVTKSLHAGNFGSVAAADTICQNTATAANLGGNWKAWLSDGVTTGGRARVGSNGPWALLDGSLVFAQSNVTSPMRDLDIDETGTAGNKGFVWTGTKSDGTPSGTNCNNWAGGGSATTGYPHEKLKWTDDESSGSPCNFRGHLYCFEQP